ncbi:MAG: helix-turn-helix transcriptional regulator [Pseudobutyrivibrio sp.]|nr:helix-turn-helix transcriptional regulator [Pseudobutyrivibrio sp.]
MKSNKSDTYKYLAQNIKTLRKKNSMTQEKLADILGVTVGAVYKWESAQSVPELVLLIEIADLFEVSVDALLGFEIKNDSIDQVVSSINHYVELRDWDNALAEINNGLQRYPNNFDIVYLEANVCRMIFIDNADKSMLVRSTDSYQRAQVLLANNHTQKQARINLHKEIALNYLLENQIQLAVDTLVENNTCGVNNSSIGLLYIGHLKDYESAKTYLSEAMMRSIEETITASIGYAKTLYMKHDNSCIDYLTWLINYLDNLKMDKSAIAATDKIKAAIMSYYCCWNLEFNHRDEAYRAMQETIELVKRFDSMPYESLSEVRFVDDPAFFALDDIGKTAKGAVEKVLYADHFLKNNKTELQEMWEKAGFK